MSPTLLGESLAPCVTKPKIVILVVNNVAVIMGTLVNFARNGPMPTQQNAIPNLHFCELEKRGPTTGTFFMSFNYF